MVLRLGLPECKRQIAGELPRRWLTTRPPPISSFCTYANIWRIRIGMDRAMNSLLIDTKAADKHTEFSEILTAGSSQKYHERTG